jgi:tRNA(Ile)-lysidine synthase TilS/MesJ
MATGEKDGTVWIDTESGDDKAGDGTRLRPLRTVNEFARREPVLRRSVTITFVSHRKELARAPRKSAKARHRVLERPRFDQPHGSGARCEDERRVHDRVRKQTLA